MLPNGEIVTSIDVLGWCNITHDYYQRYQKPVMYTETNVFDAQEAPTWLWKQWINVLRMRQDGVPGWASRGIRSSTSLTGTRP